MGRDPFHQPRVLQAPSNLALNIARDGAATASLANMFPCFTALRVKNFCIISDLKSTLSQSEAITSCPITTGPCKKSLSIEANTNIL